MEINKNEETVNEKPAPRSYMNEQQYSQLLLEVNYIGHVLTSLQMEERNTLHALSSPKFNKDIHLNAKLARLRSDLQYVQQIGTIQQKLINAEIERRYALKFKYLPVESYDEILKQAAAQSAKATQAQKVSQQEDGVQRDLVRQPEGGDLRTSTGDQKEEPLQPSSGDNPPAEV